MKMVLAPSGKFWGSVELQQGVGGREHGCSQAKLDKGEQWMVRSGLPIERNSSHKIQHPQWIFTHNKRKTTQQLWLHERIPSLRISLRIGNSHRLSWPRYHVPLPPPLVDSMKPIVSINWRWVRFGSRCCCHCDLYPLPSRCRFIPYHPPCMRRAIRPWRWSGPTPARCCRIVPATIGFLQYHWLPTHSTAYQVAP